MIFGVGEGALVLVGARGALWEGAEGAELGSHLMISAGGRLVAGGMLAWGFFSASFMKSYRSYGRISR